MKKRFDDGTKLGDVFLFSLQTEELKFTQDKKLKIWTPQKNEKIGIAQVVAIDSASGEKLLALGGSWFEYDEEKSQKLEIGQIDIKFMCVLADFATSNGLYKMIGNQPISSTMPYLMYKQGFAPSRNIKVLPFSNVKVVSWQNPIPEGMPVAGAYFSGGAIAHLMQGYFFNENFFYEDNWEFEIAASLVNEKYLVKNFFSAAENNPQWILDYYEVNFIKRK